MSATKDKIIEVYAPSPMELANELGYYDKTCLIVEGATDVCFWNNIQDTIDEKIIIRKGNKKECCGNKDYVIKVIIEVNKRSYKNKVFGVIDLDYDYVENNVKCINNLYYYKYHDFEIMLIMSDVFSKINNIISSSGKKKSDELLRELLLKNTYPLGIIRLLNNKYSIGIKFDDIQLTKFLDNSTLRVDEDGLLDYIYSVLKLSKEDRHIFTNHFNELKSKEYKAEYICNGHDVIKLLSEFTNKVISNDQPIKYIEEIITMLLSAEYFLRYMRNGKELANHTDLVDFYDSFSCALHK